MTIVCVKKILIVVLLYSSFSLFANEFHLENNIYIVPQTLINGFESFYISGKADVAGKKSPEEPETFIFVKADVIFTAPDYVLNKVVFIEQTVKNYAQETLRFSKKTTKPQSSQKHQLCKQIPTYPIDGLPLKYINALAAVTTVFPISVLEKCPLNAVAVSKVYNGFLLSVKRGYKAIFYHYCQLYFRPFFQNYTTRPPPFIV